MSDVNVKVISPSMFIGNSELGPFPIEWYTKKYLAQGDSWFSIGHLPPWGTTNLLENLELSRSTCIVNCAHPGRTLQHMTDTSTEPMFLRLLRGKLAYEWDAILLSGGGNDLIDAAQLGPNMNRDMRLLAIKSEWRDPALGGARYLSEDGWKTFVDHMKQVFDIFMTAKAVDLNRKTPVLLHTYDYVTPRNSPAGPGFGPWLFKAVTAFGIPEADWILVSNELLNRLGALLSELATQYAGVQVIDTLGTLDAAQTSDIGPTQDWQNEIHPTAHGYRQLDVRWRQALDSLP